MSFSLRFEVNLTVCIISFTVFPSISGYTVYLSINQSCVSSYKNVLRSDEESEKDKEGEASVCSDTGTIVT